MASALPAPERPAAVVPFLDLAPLHAPLRAELLAAFGDLIDASAFVNGPAVSAFEAAFAGYCGSRRSVGVASGLDALRLGLIACGVEPGDEVIVPANTFVATLEAVSQAGATPVPADVTETDYNLDVDAVRAAVSERTRYLMPVHLYGQMADMHALLQLAEERGLRVIEDACQAHGAERDGLRAGATGAAAAGFSFYPGKNLGAMGDAGALTTEDEAIADRVLALREHGQTRKYEHDVEGWTARLDAIQAVVLTRKLERLDAWNDLRRHAAAWYDEELNGVGDLRLPQTVEGSTHVWHLYVVRTADPVGFAAHLAARGISTGRHYPEPPHLSRAYAHLGYPKGSFPAAERHASEVVSLPIFPGIAEEQLAAVAHAIADYFRRAA
ncbi:MAG: DegT/DnrJ/EryC1/StrS family aminotransferase [Gaiellaceae bacterium]